MVQHQRQLRSTYPALFAEHVVMHHADIGPSRSTARRRVVQACEHGRLIDGDQLMATIAPVDGRWPAGRRRRGRHRDVQSRPRALFSARASLSCAAASGDRYVLERMRADGYNLGGEQSATSS